MSEETPAADGFPNDRRKRNIPVATDRRGIDRRKKNIPVAVDRRSGKDRRAQQGERRRQIDPTTCERDYTDDESEFMKAMDRYKRDNRRPFPTWSEVLEVLSSLGSPALTKTCIAASLPQGKY